MLRKTPTSFIPLPSSVKLFTVASTTSTLSFDQVVSKMNNNNNNNNNARLSFFRNYFKVPTSSASATTSPFASSIAAASPISSYLSSFLQSSSNNQQQEQEQQEKQQELEDEAILETKKKGSKKPKGSHKKEKGGSSGEKSGTGGGGGGSGSGSGGSNNNDNNDNENNNNEDGGGDHVHPPNNQAGDEAVNKFLNRVTGLVFGITCLSGLAYYVANPHGKHVSWREIYPIADSVEDIRVYNTYAQLTLGDEYAYVGTRPETTSYTDDQIRELLKQRTTESDRVSVNFVGTSTGERFLHWIEVWSFVVPFIFFPLFTLVVSRAAASIVYDNAKFTTAIGGRREALLTQAGEQFQIAKKTSTRFRDIAGMVEAKGEIVEIVDFLKHPDRYTQMGAKIPAGALLLGPPGTGKTLLAKAVAGESHTPFIACNGSDFVELYAGMGALRVRKLFEMARSVDKCIIYIDEIDSIGSKRTGSGMGEQSEQEHTLNELLTQLDGFNKEKDRIIVLASTNVDKSALDTALVRPGRFDRIVNVEAPVLIERVELFKTYLKKLKLLPTIMDTAASGTSIDGDKKKEKKSGEQVAAEAISAIAQAAGTSADNIGVIAATTPTSAAAAADVSSTTSKAIQKEQEEVKKVEENETLKKVTEEQKQETKNKEENIKEVTSTSISTSTEKQEKQQQEEESKNVKMEKQNLTSETTTKQEKEKEEEEKKKEQKQEDKKQVKEEKGETKKTLTSTETQMVIHPTANVVADDAAATTKTEKENEKSSENEAKVETSSSSSTKQESEKKSTSTSTSAATVVDDEVDELEDDKQRDSNFINEQTPDFLALVDNLADRMSGLCPGFVGSDIASVCNEAAILAARERSNTVTMSHLERSIDRVLAGIEQRSRVLSDFEKKVVAHHEAGHAVAGWFLGRADPLMKVSIVPRGGKALGYAQYLPNENQIRTSAEIEDSICVSLGGRVAEKIFFDHLSTGASDDLQKVRRMAYMHASSFGRNTAVDSPGSSSTRYTKPYGENIENQIDDTAKQLVDRLYQRTYDILLKHKSLMEELASHLLKYEVLTHTDILKYLGPRMERPSDTRKLF